MFQFIYILTTYKNQLYKNTNIQNSNYNNIEKKGEIYNQYLTNQYF